jgi:predicted acyltransferase
LQRIAICYLFSAILTLHIPPKHHIKVFGIIIFIILAGYWIIFKFVLAPGVSSIEYLSKEGNLAGYIDRLIIPGRLYYEYGDNEGLLSTLTAFATTLMGALTGTILKTSKSQIYKILWMLVTGMVFTVAGIFWSFIFPFNKILWTSSYALAAGGFSLLLLCLFYWLIDYKGYKKWAFPFIVIGMNAITIYVVQGLFDFGILVNIVIHGFVDYMGPIKNIFFFICVITLKWFFLYFLYKKKIFLKI